MPAATKKQPKQAAREHQVKGLETDESLDKILQQYSEKRSQQLLNDNTLFVKEAPCKPELGTKAARRARRKELQARGASAPATMPSGDDNQESCLRCGNFSCRLMHWLPGQYAEGQFECLLCTKSGNAAAGVYHCLECNWDAHVSCYNRRKEVMELAEKVPVAVPIPNADADCPKPSLAWDPLALTGPHMAIGAGASLRSVGEVALD